MTKKVFAVALFSLLLWTPNVYGIEYNLADLIDNNKQVTVGDKIFYGFFFSVTPPADCTADNSCSWSSGAGGITVEPMYWGSYPSGSPSSGDPLIPTIRFGGTIGYLALDSKSSLPAVAADVRLGYYVKTANGLRLIKDIHQSFNATIVGYRSNVTVKEQVYTASGTQPIGHSTLVAGASDFVDPPGEVTQNDILDLTNAPYSQVYVEKDIQLYAVNGGLAAISIEDQGISELPEPGFYGALALGLSGLVLAFRRRSAAK